MGTGRVQISLDLRPGNPDTAWFGTRVIGGCWYKAVTASAIGSYVYATYKCRAAIYDETGRQLAELGNLDIHGMVSVASSDFFFVGNKGTVGVFFARDTGSSRVWLPQASGTTATLRAVAKASTGPDYRLVVVGDSGIILVSDGYSGTTALRAGPGASGTSAGLSLRPLGSELLIGLPSGLAGRPAKISVHDISGKAMRVPAIPVPAGFRLSLDGLPRGVYGIRVEGNGVILHTRFTRLK